VLFGSCGDGDGGGGSTAPPLTATAEILYSFGSTSTDAMGPGAWPAVLLQGSDGNFYGISSGGGIGGGGTGAGITGNGTVFKITPTGEETILHLFAGAPDDGANPVVLIQGSDGNFYGTTFKGGGDDVGTVFKLTPEGVETILVSFAGAAGASPAGGLIQGSDGNFYGTTEAGGARGGGTVFKLTPQGVETILYSFTGGSDGAYPFGQLLQGSDGNFYGVTNQGGNETCPDGQAEISCGTVFKVTPEGIETILFSGPDLQSPNGGLLLGSDGNLYGTTPSVVFELTPEGVETIYAFPLNSPTDGAFIISGLLQGNDGNFYGTASEGGENGSGIMFQLTPGGALTTLYSFPSSPTADNGDSMPGSLVQGSDGNFYGATAQGGAYDRGYFFKLVLSH
jgi:uncharacterized repeat protein (TIGR03803 family)